MGGITRIIYSDSPNPELLKARLEERREREAGGVEKNSKEKRVKFSKLQLVIILECVKSGKDSGSYSTPLESIIDKYYGKRSGMRIAKMSAVRRAVKTLEKKGLAELMAGLVSRVELTPNAIEIAKGHK